ncbi:MAG: sulfite exporter TauE/SafE family protein [Acidobacteriota bacterium]|nr:sulfite exporter TauE/SafE family protein [Acidobacteriota bacterium]
MTLLVLGIVLAGAAAGCVGTMLGLGGGIFLVPFLNLVVGLPFHSAVGVSLVTIIATSSVTATNPAQREVTNLKLGMLLEAFSAPAALMAAYWAQAISEPTLRRVFALSAIGIALVMVTRLNKRNVVLDPAFETGPLGGRFFEAESGAVVSYSVKRVPLACGASVLAGVLSGLIGIGGGIVKVPVLNAWCGVPLRAAAATSAFMIGITVVASAIPYYVHGDVVPHFAAATVLGVLAGGRLGIWLGSRVKARGLKLLMIAMLVGVAITYLIKAGV